MQFVYMNSGDYAMVRQRWDIFRESWLVVPANRLRANREEKPINVLQFTYAD